MAETNRPAFIANIRDGLQPIGHDDLSGLGSPVGRAQGLTRIGIHHEVIPPGNRSSYPHAESHQDEFVLVLKGIPDVWIDGVLYPLVEGDCVAFPYGTGIAHSFLNNSNEDIHLLIIGEANKDENRLNYPINPERMVEFAKRGLAWHDAPKHELGPHDGKARAGTRKA